MYRPALLSPSPSCRPSVKLGRRTIVLLQAARPPRSGLLRVVLHPLAARQACARAAHRLKARAPTLGTASACALCKGAAPLNRVWLWRAICPSAAGEPSRSAATRHACVPDRHEYVNPGKEVNAFRLAAAREALPSVNVGQFVGAGAVAPARLARSRAQWCRLDRSGRVVVEPAGHESSASEA